MPEAQCQGLLPLIWTALDSTTCKDTALTYMWHHIPMILVLALHCS